MGIIHPGPPKDLVLQLKKSYDINKFVETGTYNGDTAVWAASHFNEVITIELARDVFEETATKYGHMKQIRFEYGDSRVVLQAIRSELARPAIIWLDAHWSGGHTAGKNHECPLLEEIAALTATGTSHFIMIDDARLFLSPPPRPHCAEQWPSIDQVIAAIQSAKQAYYVAVVDDVIVAVPETARELVVQYCQEVNSRTWSALVKKAPLNLSSSLPRHVHQTVPHTTWGQVTDWLEEFKRLGLWREWQPLRLHLGCGEQRFEGYINIDYPGPLHTVQTKRAADVFTDITRLRFPQQCVDEIRLHHVLEHFDRPRALGLLILWNQWLKMGGKLHIETPDFLNSARQIASNIPYLTQQAILRHLFGSQEAVWAYHCDGWYAEKYQRVLPRFGFSIQCIRSWHWPHPPHLANVEVVAIKTAEMSYAELLAAADAVLAESVVADVSSERAMLDGWRLNLRHFVSDGLYAVANEDSIPCEGGQWPGIRPDTRRAARAKVEPISN